MADEGSVDRLEKKLYSGNNDTHLRRTRFMLRGDSTKKTWSPKPPEPNKKPAPKPLELLFLGSIVFFLIAVAVAGMLFFGGNNTVSTKNVDIRITAPSEIGAGSTLSLQVVVTNRNAVPMELTDLVLEFPPGTRSAFDVSTDLPRTREALGTIQPGKSVNRTVRAVVFGLQGQNLPVKISVEYRVPSSNAIFFSEAEHTLRINESPAAISIDALTEAVSGQKTSFTVTVRSNAPEVLKDMLLTAQYPPGFAFDSSTPSPVVGQNIWYVGDIEPGGERKITISGVFTGEEGESRVMHLAAGNRKEGTEDTIAAPLAMADMSLTVTKPFVSVQLALNGARSSVHAISRGQAVTGSIAWANNLPVRIQNLSITLLLNGQIIDKFEIKAPRGFYNSNTSSIIWDRSTNTALADIAPGEFGVEEFTFAVLPPGEGDFKNPEVNLSVMVKADRLSETNVPETLQTSATTKALVATSLQLNGSVAVQSGFNPPKVGAQTSYRATWEVKNVGNAVANSKVTAVLPAYVVYLGGPDDIAYDTSERTVTWNLGDIQAGGTRSISFQIATTPSTSQIGTSPLIIRSQKLTALDRFARIEIQKVASDIGVKDAPGGGTVTP